MIIKNLTFIYSYVFSKKKIEKTFLHLVKNISRSENKNFAAQKMTVDKIFNKLGVGEFLFPKTNIEQSVYSPQYPYQFDMDVTQRKVFPNFVHENEPFDYRYVLTAKLVRLLFLIGF